jgi:tight adherence protein C
VSPLLAGGLLGLTLGAGLLLVLARVRTIRRPSLATRVLPYLRDLPQSGRPATPLTGEPRSVVTAVFGPFLRAAADGVERVLGGSSSVRRRLERAGLDQTVHDLRVEQVLWGLGGFAVAAAYGLLRSWTTATAAWSSLVVALIAFAFGVLARSRRVTWLVR